MPATFAPDKHLSCAELIPEIIKASEQRAAKDPLNWPIASIDKPASMEETPRDYECKATARLSNSESVKIVYGRTDAHGHQAPVYKLEEG